MANEIRRTFLLGDRYPASRDYPSSASTAYHPLFRAITYIRHFPFLRIVHDYVPGWVYERHLPMAGYAREAENGIRGMIREHDQDVALGRERTEAALLYRLIEQDPSYRDHRAAPAIEEFLELLWGGREVMGHAMTTISFHLATNPACMERLRAELHGAPFDLSTASFVRLQKLPYLYGVCKEGIRMQLGGGFRIPRTNPDPDQHVSQLLPLRSRRLSGPARLQARAVGGCRARGARCSRALLETVRQRHPQLRWTQHGARGRVSRYRKCLSRFLDDPGWFGCCWVPCRWYAESVPSRPLQGFERQGGAGGVIVRHATSAAV